MMSLDLNLHVLTKELSVYLENQVRVGGFLGSGVGLALALGFGAAYACYYWTSVAKKPKLVSGGKKFYDFLNENCPVVTETYYPTFWCWESRVQTLLRPFVTAKPGVSYRNAPVLGIEKEHKKSMMLPPPCFTVGMVDIGELIRAPDGGQISLDWFDNEDSPSHPDSSTRPTVLLLPGLTGTSRESYILHMVQQSRELGYRCVVFNNRGVSGEKLLTPRTYCAANTEDLEMVINHVNNTHPIAPIMAAGVSMGGVKSFSTDSASEHTGLKSWPSILPPKHTHTYTHTHTHTVRMMLANYLGRKGSATCLKGVVVFSAGWDVFECTVSLEKPLDRFLFNSYLTSCLQASVHRHRPVLERNYDIDHVMKAKTIREFDERFTSKMFGYPTNDDYYRDASPIHKLKSVQVPMLCLNAADDVFSPNHAIPIEVVKQNPNLALLITCHGGHIGFLEGFWPRHSTYMDRVFRQFIKAVVENGSALTDLAS
ncbi:phospholipase ABHD3 isoform X2 [Tachysurus vachellii]|uniref:phospholipase ABHD3 isoform X2 n=1 Tax=Tachysurus vachellii TaxID=175792 RepID=UPI00296AA29B|nr:phospholipase ABHD3 isoform X2 [Tachysurus vachellii]